MRHHWYLWTAIIILAAISFTWMFCFRLSDRDFPIIIEKRIEYHGGLNVGESNSNEINDYINNELKNHKSFWTPSIITYAPQKYWYFGRTSSGKRISIKEWNTMWIINIGEIQMVKNK